MMVIAVSCALGAFYTQFMSILVILFVYSTSLPSRRLRFRTPVAPLRCWLLAWFTGCAVGLMLSWRSNRGFQHVTMLNNVYRRMNMVFSGKMFVANALGGSC